MILLASVIVKGRMITMKLTINKIIIFVIISLITYMHQYLNIILRIAIYSTVILLTYNMLKDQCTQTYNHMLSNIQPEVHNKSISINVNIESDNKQMPILPQKQQQPFLLGDSELVRDKDIIKMFVSVCKKYISHNYKQYQFLICPLLDILQMCIPTTFFRSLFALIPLAVSLIFGGGLNYFNRSIKQLNKHSSKIQKGIDFKQKFIRQSQKIIQIYKNNTQPKDKCIVDYTLFKNKYRQFDELQRFITNANYSFKFIESRQRKDLSLMLYNWMKHNFCQIHQSFYLNLKVTPFNHQEANNSCTAILQTILYSILHQQDRSKSLRLLKLILKIGYVIVNFIKELLMQEWNEVQIVALMIGACEYYYYHCITKTLILYLPCKYLIQALKSYRKGIKSDRLNLKKPFIILDHFQCIKRQLRLTQLQKDLQQKKSLVQLNKLLFENIINLSHRIHSNKGIQIIVIIQQSQFFQSCLCPVLPKAVERNYHKKELDVFSFKDTTFLSNYINVQNKILKCMLASLSDQSELFIIKNLGIYHCNDIPLAIYTNIIRKSINKLDQLVKTKMDQNQLIIILLKKLLNHQIKESSEEMNEQITQQKITLSIKQFYRALYHNILRESNCQSAKRKQIIDNLFRLQFNLKKIRYSFCQEEIFNNKQEIAVLSMLNDVQILFNKQFYSKSQQISAYLYLVITKNM